MYAVNGESVIAYVFESPCTLLYCPEEEV